MFQYEKVMTASEIVISGMKRNDIFIEIDLCLCATTPNKNHESVTEEFIDEIVGDPNTYNCIPLYCDVRNLLNGNYDRLTHMQNKISGTFGTTQIGALTDFRKEKDGDVSKLIATARVPKRERDICLRLAEMYELGILSFSFEVLYVKADTIVEDGTRFVDASDRNFIFGMTVVSIPAFKESVALQMVAEDQTVSAVNEDEVKQEMDHNKPEQDVQIEEQVQEAPETAIAEQANEANEQGTAPVDAATSAQDTPADTAVAEANPTESETQPEAMVAENETPAEVVDAAPVAADPVVPATETATAELCDECAECAPPTPLDAEVDAAHAAIEAEAAQLRVQIARLEAEIEALRAEHVELEAYRAAQRAAELQSKQEQARMFALSQHLNPEDDAVATAIAEVNYEALATLSMQNAPKETATAEFHNGINLGNFSDSIGIKANNDIGAWLYERSEERVK